MIKHLLKGNLFSVCLYLNMCLAVKAADKQAQKEKEKQKEKSIGESSSITTS